LNLQVQRVLFLLEQASAMTPYNPPTAQLRLL